MKKELILLACMITGPYILSSADNRSDTAGTDTIKEDYSCAIWNPHDSDFLRNDTAEKYNHLIDYVQAVAKVDTGRIPEQPPSATLLERKTYNKPSSIKANWILDTTASKTAAMLVYVDKDNPELKAFIFTDNSGRMIMKLEQHGKFHEIMIDKVEFHMVLGIQRRASLNGEQTRVGRFDNLINKVNVTCVWKGGAYVPV